MTREQAMARVNEGFQKLLKAEEDAIANNASVIDYCFKCDRIAKLNFELRKRISMLNRILEIEAQNELDFGVDKKLLQD